MVTDAGSGQMHHGVHAMQCVRVDHPLFGIPHDRIGLSPAPNDRDHLVTLGAKVGNQH
jgi:hypothetical protein